MEIQGFENLFKIHAVTCAIAAIIIVHRRYEKGDSMLIRSIYRWCTVLSGFQPVRHISGWRLRNGGCIVLIQERQFQLADTCRSCSFRGLWPTLAMNVDLSISVRECFFQGMDNICSSACLVGVCVTAGGFYQG